MPKKPLISIVLPTHNGQRYIRQSIRSCLNQTHKNIELIIVNDGSEDDTEKIVKSFRDPRIKYYGFKNNLGLPHILNEGFKHARGDFFTWISDDNVFHKKALQVMLEFLTDHHQDFVYTDYWIKNETDKIFAKRKIKNFREGNFVGPSFLYSKKLAKKIGLYDPDKELIEDYDYWFRASKEFKLNYLPKKLYFYRYSQETLTYKKEREIQILFELQKSKYCLESASSIKRRIIYLAPKANILLVNSLLVLLKLNLLGFKKTCHLLLRK